jgi:hypothetical protein
MVMNGQPTGPEPCDGKQGFGRLARAVKVSMLSREKHRRAGFSWTVFTVSSVRLASTRRRRSSAKRARLSSVTRAAVEVSLNPANRRVTWI